MELVAWHTHQRCFKSLLLAMGLNVNMQLSASARQVGVAELDPSDNIATWHVCIGDRVDGCASLPSTAEEFSEGAV